MRVLYVVALCGACGFRVPNDNGSAGTFDAPPDVEMTGIDFLPPSEEHEGATSWTVSIDTVIDTQLMSITPAGPITLAAGVQDDGSPIAIVRVADFTIDANRTLQAIGDKPLAILAGHDVTIDGTLDAGGHLAVNGAGGAPPTMGHGPGGAGVHDDGTGSTYDDTGAGGGSFGTAGGTGGAVGHFPGGTPGPTYTLTSLFGGSGGGKPAGTCANVGGGGGGALLIYAEHAVTISGAITAGGGGGGGGTAVCGTGAGSGAGGGSGGVIWIQTRGLGGTGTVAANGGGGGGGSYVGVSDGGPGQDGQPSATRVAVGGTKANSAGASAGGSGAIEGTPPSTIVLLAAGNGGGGGGGLGRIVFHAPPVTTLQTSPTAVSP